MSLRTPQSAPILIDGNGNGNGVAWKRVLLGSPDSGDLRESFLQQLVHDHPEIMPMAEIEPAFTPLIPICMELPTTAGILDNLWMTPAGGIIIGECKLARNPQARREVVAQALDYAAALHGLHYSEFEAAVLRGQSMAGETLWEAVAEQAFLDEAQFIDAVERRLRSGRFMVMIITDGIREGVEELTEFLQMHAGLHTGLALLDLTIWKDGPNRILVVPRVPMKTVLVERGVVRIAEDASIRIEASSKLPDTSSQGAPAQPYTISEVEFFEQLDQSVPGGDVCLKEFLHLTVKAGIEAEFRKTLVLRFSTASEGTVSAGYIESNGKVIAGDGWWYAKKAGQVAAGQRYMESLRDLIGGELRQYESSKAPFLLGPDGTGARLGDFADKARGWAEITNAFVHALSDDV